jgi:hypothetical protein
MHANERESRGKEPQVNASERNKKKKSVLIGANRWIMSDESAKSAVELRSLGGFDPMVPAGRNYGVKPFRNSEWRSIR